MTAAEGQSPDEPGYEIVMPFVTVASKGGPHDDASYACGWEMGSLDRDLAGHPSRLVRTLHEVNRPQVDLLSMKHGYRMAVVNTEDGWDQVTFTRLGL